MTKKKLTVILIGVLILVLLTGCSGGVESELKTLIVEEAGFRVPQGGELNVIIESEKTSAMNEEWTEYDIIIQQIDKQGNELNNRFDLVASKTSDGLKLIALQDNF